MVQSLYSRKYQNQIEYPSLNPRCPTQDPSNQSANHGTRSAVLKSGTLERFAPYLVSGEGGRNLWTSVPLVDLDMGIGIEVSPALQRKNLIQAEETYPKRNCKSTGMNCRGIEGCLAGVEGNP